MSRAEFERRLLHDPELRQRMEMVGKLAQRHRDAEADLELAVKERNAEIMALANQGVPLAAIARLVSITPQRLGVIVRENS